VRMASIPSTALEIRGPAIGLLDDPLLLRVRGAGPDAELRWRARFRDDDGRVWRAAATRAEDLATSWWPAKEGGPPVAALRSLLPVSIDVRAECADGRAAARTISRSLAADGVRIRRWLTGMTAVLHLPPVDDPCATLIIDATTGPSEAAAAWLAAPLLASRGAVVLALALARSRGLGDPLAVAREQLAAVPAATQPILVLQVRDPLSDEAQQGEAVVLPPGVGAREGGPDGAAARAVAWDALLERLGAAPRTLAV
jgi:hypothetical protein